MSFLRLTKKAVPAFLLIAQQILVLSGSIALAEDSKLAGEWTLVKGKRQVTLKGQRREEQLPQWNEHQPFVVINTDGSLSMLQGGGFVELDRLRHKGDRMDDLGSITGHIEVEACKHTDEVIELHLLCHDAEKNQEYRISYEMRLMPNGELSYRHVLPYPGSGGEEVNATLKRIEARDAGSVPGLVREFKGHRGNVESVAYSPDGRYILSGGLDKTIRLWNVKTGEEIRRFVGHQRGVTCVAFSPDGRLAASGSAESLGRKQGEDHSVRIWEVETGHQLHQFRAFKYVTSVAFSPPEGRYLLASGGVTSVRYTVEPATALMWNVSTGQLQSKFFNKAGKVRSAAFSPDGQYVLCAPIVSTTYKRFCLFEAQTGQLIRCFGEVGPAPNSICFSQDGRRILTSSDMESIREWDLETGEPLSNLGSRLSASWCALYLPEGRGVLAAGIDKDIRIWNLETAVERRRFAGHHAAVKCLAIAPDGRHVVSGSDDGAIILWDVGQ